MARCYNNNAVLSAYLVFQGLEKMKNITFSLIISKSVYVILIFCLVKTNHVERVFLALVLSNVVTLVISNYLLYRNGYAIGTPCNKLFRDEIKIVFHFLSRAAVGVYTSASTFIVGSFAGLNQAAVYSSAEKIISSRAKCFIANISSIISIFSKVWR